MRAIRRRMFMRSKKSGGPVFTLCVDALDCVCTSYHDMVRAAFPVRCWLGEGRQSAAEQGKSQRMAKIVNAGLWPGMLH